ncbi:MAG: GNAT family N-acetyltransferase [candidate division Zixibacteria bacterium]|nr:GNAT family N-acetyltransferase [candidate division Zixibacteria bacterium]
MPDLNTHLLDLLEKWQSLSEPNKELSDAILTLTHDIINKDVIREIDTAVWHRYLDLTGHFTFLQSLPDKQARYDWADTTLKIIPSINFTLLDMFEQRVAKDPDKTLFQDMAGTKPALWSYKLIAERVHSIASVFYGTKKIPRVAILSNNCVEGACCDMACMFYDILVTPLNVHFDSATIEWILNELQINIVVADTEDHLKVFENIKANSHLSFQIYSLNGTEHNNKEVENLHKICVEMASTEKTELIENRPRFGLDEVCTVMFTSGSTGKPKGVTFSQFNLVSKRYCRAAALPNVGDNEVLLCYLPLFHTFGRYFEMLGMVYWAGTYVFPGNPSVETLMLQLSQVNPTGLISVPLRWMQIQEKCLERMGQYSDKDSRSKVFRQVAGNRLHWGLSAAGYLSPKAFRFFNKNGVKLCSGFGMTEATGGITMTPPGEYQENSIGIPLPGIQTRFSDEGELQICGSYLGQYLDDVGPGDIIPIAPLEKDEFWLKTGDLFRVLENGHYEIIDRLKDIYKNNKGQTIAPRKVEKKFEGVSGIARTFLVGDARQYNVLLIVPDNNDPVLQNITSDESLREYLHQIVTNANQDLAPYERIINFDILDRDFTIDDGELTPKGSFRRKTIENNFKDVINELYKNPFVEVSFDEFIIRIPRWFYRDLGILEDVIQVCENGLLNTRSDLTLIISKTDKDGVVLIGDLEYELSGNTIDLGILSKQPKLWMGNGALIRFCPCREGWDLPLKPFGKLVFLPFGRKDQPSKVGQIRPALVSDRSLTMMNQMIYYALFDEKESALRAVRQLEKSLNDLDERIARVVRWRLVALSRHPEFELRALAYRILLLDKPSSDYNEMMPAFIDSGLLFLDEDSIQEIAHLDIKERRLEALRQRLFQYRDRLQWPASDNTCLQFEHILKLLTNFAKYHPEFYNTMRAELAGWIMHKAEPRLAKKAEILFTGLYKHYEAELSNKTPNVAPEIWVRKIVFGEELTDIEINRISQVLIDTTFLKQSILLAFDEESFEIGDVPVGGIWISRIISRRSNLRYRISINTKTGKHFDLQLILNEDYSKPSVMNTIYWLMIISNYPYGSRVLPRLGCCRLDLEARSLVYFGDLTAWERIREYASRGRTAAGFQGPRKEQWRKLFIKSLSAFFKGWKISGKRIVPGAVAPENVFVPEQDFREGAAILSISGWKNYENTLSLIKPMVLSFFKKTSAHYPWCREYTTITWLFDACIEEMGIDEGKLFLNQLQNDIKSIQASGEKSWFQRKLEVYIWNLGKYYYVPINLQSAIDRYVEWEEVNPTATTEAKGQTVGELYRLYRLDRFGEITRYYLYRHTCYKDVGEKVCVAFDRLLKRLFMHPDIPAIQMIELTDLQATIKDPYSRKLFSQLVFPKSQKSQHMEISAVGESGHQYVIVRTSMVDKQGEEFTFREPLEPSEIGQLYRLFFKEGYPKTVSERDKYIVIVDLNQQIIGGLCYRDDGEGFVSLDGSVVAGPFMGRGIGSSLIDDFCSRMANRGVKVIKTHFFLRRFYTKHGFTVDSRWGALVRFLEPPEDVDE